MIFANADILTPPIPTKCILTQILSTFSFEKRKGWQKKIHKTANKKRGFCLRVYLIIYIRGMICKLQSEPVLCFEIASSPAVPRNDINASLRGGRSPTRQSQNPGIFLANRKILTV